MNDRTMQAVVNAIVDGTSGNRRADWNIASGKRLGKADDVWPEIGNPLTGQKTSRAALYCASRQGISRLDHGVLVTEWGSEFSQGF